MPNLGPYIYDVSISGFTRSSIYIYDISSLRVDTLLEKGWNTNGTIIVCIVFPFVKALGTVATKKPPSRMLTSRKVSFST